MPIDLPSVANGSTDAAFLPRRRAPQAGTQALSAAGAAGLCDKFAKAGRRAGDRGLRRRDPIAIEQMRRSERINAGSLHQSKAIHRFALLFAPSITVPVERTFIELRQWASPSERITH